MTAHTRHLFTAFLMLLAALTGISHKAAAQPWLPIGGDYIRGGDSGIHIFLPSQFLTSICEDRLLFARVRYYRQAYHQAADRGDYAQALIWTDSLIYATEHHSVKGIRFSKCYKDRALMLQALGRTAEACEAFDRAVKVQDSAMRLEQSDTMREMQASYELDRMALEQALIKARHHKTALISLELLLLAALCVIGFIYIGNRRTQRLQRELLLQIEHVRRSEEKKTDFINSICHEVRTPLNCITGFSELLCAEETTSEAHVQYSEIIRENRRQLRYLFDDMLEVAYLENLSESLPHSYMDLCALCRTQLRIMKVRFPKPGVIYTEGIPTENIGISTNEKYLGILISALLNNAYKFTQQGTIRIECGRAGDERIFISVTDTGCGIPADQYAYVFERFTKLDAFSQGNGLGLYLCQLIARHLGGSIRIDAEYTAGTRFVVTLPRRMDA